jgi:hypothetical protein
MESLYPLLSGIAGGFSLAAYVPLLEAIFRREYAPERATWFIWCVVTGVIALAYIANGLWLSAIVPLGYSLGCASIALLSIKYGVGGWTKTDKRCIAISATGILLWLVTGNELIALFLNILAEAAGAVPTVLRAWDDPNSEPRTGWIIFLLGGITSFFAASSWNVVSLAYPVFIILLQGTIVWRLSLKKEPKIGTSHPNNS